mgnify:CR=1 FL=1
MQPASSHVTVCTGLYTAVGMLMSCKMRDRERGGGGRGGNVGNPKRAHRALGNAVHPGERLARHGLRRQAVMAA